jgi:hypothetical protein
MRTAPGSGHSRVFEFKRKKHYKGILTPEKLDNFVDSEPNNRNRYSKRKSLFLTSISGFYNIQCAETYRLKFQYNFTLRNRHYRNHIGCEYVYDKQS